MRLIWPRTLGVRVETARSKSTGLSVCMPLSTAPSSSAGSVGSPSVRSTTRFTAPMFEASRMLAIAPWCSSKSPSIRIVTSGSSSSLIHTSVTVPTTIEPAVTSPPGISPRTSSKTASIS